MKTLTALVFIIVAVLLTSLFWYVVISDHNELGIPSFGKPVEGPTAIPTPYSYATAQPIYTPTPVPTVAPTPTPTPTLGPITGTTVAVVPSFTVQYVDHSYDVPATYKTNPYTGATEVDRASYHVDNRTIEITIKNQAFTPSVTADGNTTALYYNVRAKGHYENWDDATSYHSITQFKASTSNSQTVILFFLRDWSIAENGKVDFQLETLIGYKYTYITGMCGESTATRFVTIGDSGWSSTQTISLPGPTPYPTVTP